jgi:hypothetical protein
MAGQSVGQAARRLGGKVARRPGGQAARWPGGQVARRPGGQAARRPGGKTAGQLVGPVALNGILMMTMSEGINLVLLYFPVIKKIPFFPSSFSRHNQTICIQIQMNGNGDWLESPQKK